VPAAHPPPARRVCVWDYFQIFFIVLNYFQIIFGGVSWFDFFWLGVRVSGSGFRVADRPGNWTGLAGPLLRIENITTSPTCVSGLGFQISGSEFRDSNFGIRISGFESRDSNFGIRISGFGFREHRDVADLGSGLEFGTHGCRVQVGSPTQGTFAGFRVPGWVGLGSGFRGFGVRVPGSMFRVSGAGLRDQGVRVQKDTPPRIAGWPSVATPHTSK